MIVDQWKCENPDCNKARRTLKARSDALSPAPRCFVCTNQLTRSTEVDSEPVRQRGPRREMSVGSDS